MFLVIFSVCESLYLSLCVCIFLSPLSHPLHLCVYLLFYLYISVYLWRYLYISLHVCLFLSVQLFSNEFSPFPFFVSMTCERFMTLRGGWPSIWRDELIEMYDRVFEQIYLYDCSFVDVWKSWVAWPKSDFFRKTFFLQIYPREIFILRNYFLRRHVGFRQTWIILLSMAA